MTDPATSSLIGIDVGGTGIKAVLIGSGGEVLVELRAPTPRYDSDARETAREIADLVTTIRQEFPGEGHRIGVVVPGIVDDARGVVVHASNLGWHNLAVKDVIEAAVGESISFGHDVRAGAVAEADTLPQDGVTVFVAIGTGLALATLVDGVPLVSAGWSGEVGQLTDLFGHSSGCRLEEVCSASGIARRAGRSDAQQVLTAALGGSEPDQVVWAGAVAVLADVLAAATAILGVSTVIVGGGLSRAGNALFDPLCDALDQRLGILRRPLVQPARHGDLAGARGAAMLARRMQALL